MAAAPSSIRCLGSRLGSGARVSSILPLFTPRSAAKEGGRAASARPRSGVIFLSLLTGRQTQSRGLSPTSADRKEEQRRVCGVRRHARPRLPATPLLSALLSHAPWRRQRRRLLRRTRFAAPPRQGTDCRQQPDAPPGEQRARLSASRRRAATVRRPSALWGGASSARVGLGLFST